MRTVSRRLLPPLVALSLGLGGLVLARGTGGARPARAPVPIGVVSTEFATNVVCEEGEPADTIPCQVDLLLVEPVAELMTMRVTTYDGTAVAYRDYKPLDGLLVEVPVGQVKFSVPLTVVADQRCRADRQLTVVATATGTSADGTKVPGAGTTSLASVTIRDDDCAPVG